MFSFFRRPQTDAPAVQADEARAINCTEIDETRSLASPEDWLAELFGAAPSGASGVSVTASNAMRSPAVRAAVEAISEAIGGLPLHVYERGEGGARDRATDHPAYVLLHDDANDWTPASTFREQLTRDAMLHGNGYAFINRGRTGTPRELIRLRPDAVTVELDPLTGEPRYRLAEGASQRQLDRRDVLHIAAPSLDGVKGASPVQQCREAIALNIVMEALQSGTVRAEEFNSINEGLFPVLQAVAAGNERFGGSVAKLRAEVMAGTVSSREFFEAFQSGAPMLEERAAKSILTTSAAFQTLRNAMVQYFGEADKSSGASAALAEAIKMLANNLDTVIPALAVISTALGVGFVANAARAAVAARGVGAALLGAFGGPVGIAITGITVALVGLATDAAKAEAALEGVETITTDAARTLSDARGKADSAAVGVKGVGTEAAASETKVRAFAGAVGEAAQELYNLAKARQAALISDLEAKRQEASLQYTDLWKQSDRGLKARVGAGLSWDSFKADVTLAGRKLGIMSNPEAELQEGMERLKGAMGDYDEAIAEASRNLEKFAVRSSVASPAASGGTSKGRTSGGAGRSSANAAAEAEKQLQARIKATTDELRLQEHVFALRADGLDVEAEKVEAIFRLHQQFPELVGTSNAALNEQLVLMEGLALAAVDRAAAERQFIEQEDEARAVFAARRAAREREQQEAQQQIGELADFYYNAFSTRGASVWAGFKEAGLRAVSEVLAALTASLFDGKKGNLFGSLLGGIFGFAEGGQIRGPGSGTSDSILARVSNGEYVVNAKATEKYLPQLEAINRGGVPAFASGGYVGRTPRYPAPSPGSLSLTTSATVNVNAPGGGGLSPIQAKGASEALKTETAKFMERWVQNEMRPGGRLSAGR